MKVKLKKKVLVFAGVLSLACLLSVGCLGPSTKIKYTVDLDYQKPINQIAIVVEVYESNKTKTMNKLTAALSHYFGEYGVDVEVHVEHSPPLEELGVADYSERLGKDALLVIKQESQTQNTAVFDVSLYDVPSNKRVYRGVVHKPVTLGTALLNGLPGFAKKIVNSIHAAEII